ncbi:MAG: hypothetical protein R3B13_40855 [Polyangiaceae bacterium]
MTRESSPPSSGVPVLRPLVVEKEYVFASFGSLAVVITREPPTILSVRAFGQSVDGLLREYPKVGMLIAPRAPRPSLSADATRAVLREWQRLEPHSYGAVILFRSSGFAGAIQRSLVTTVMNMRRGGIPLKVSANPYEASEFLARIEPALGPARPLGSALQVFLQPYDAAEAPHSMSG